MTQTPLVAVADHECPNCGATDHRARRVERSAVLPAECRERLAAQVIRGLGGTVTR
jgi:predicted RNA-binding Zn-ribbon protein involved in translation (DUF1610 family)